MKRASKKKFPGYVGTHIKLDTLEQLDQIAERETEGNRSIAFRRAILEYVERHSNGEKVPIHLPTLGR